MLARNQQQGVLQPLAIRHAEGNVDHEVSPMQSPHGTHHMLFDGGFADIHMLLASAWLKP
jgi:hypothetical protein